MKFSGDANFITNHAAFGREIRDLIRKTTGQKRGPSEQRQATNRETSLDPSNSAKHGRAFILCHTIQQPCQFHFDCKSKIGMSAEQLDPSSRQDKGDAGEKRKFSWCPRGSNSSASGRLWLPGRMPVKLHGVNTVWRARRCRHISKKIMPALTKCS
ncbi:MAG: hypothetical protein WAO02_11325 [Verrucomicrobiia bacterium]